MSGSDCGPADLWAAMWRSVTASPRVSATTCRTVRFGAGPIWSPRFCPRAGYGEDPDGVRTGYANLAIRGKLLGPIIDEQLDPALELHPDLVTFAGGGNDMLRPRSDVRSLIRLIDLTTARLVDSGCNRGAVHRARPVRRSAARPPYHGRPAIAWRPASARWPSAAVRCWSTSGRSRNFVTRGTGPAIGCTWARSVTARSPARVLDAIGVERPADWTAPAGAAVRRTAHRPRRTRLLLGVRRPVGASPTHRDLLG